LAAECEHKKAEVAKCKPDCSHAYSTELGGAVPDKLGDEPELQNKVVDWGSAQTARRWKKTSAPTFVSAVLPLKVRPNLSL
jgi:hypothetical protein